MVAACSSPSSPAIEHPFDPCAPVHLAATGATDDQLASIDDAIALWSAAGVTAPSRQPADASLDITFEAGAPALYGYFDDAAAAIYINLELTGHDRAITIAHELGHAFGLVHIPPGQRISVMNPGNLTIAPTSDDHAAIETIWGSCPDAPAPTLLPATDHGLSR